MKRLTTAAALIVAFYAHADLTLNELEYYQQPGVNIWVYSNLFNGGFNDEKNSGIEVIHHGVRTMQGGAVRLNSTPEQWDLVPYTTSRTVNLQTGSIEVTLRYDDYDFDSRIVTTPKGDGVEIAVYLDEPVPQALEGHAGLNIELLPSQYWLKTYVVDGHVARLPRYAVSNTVAKPNAEKPRQFKGYKTYDDRGTQQYVDPLPLATGRKYVIAPESPERMVTVSSQDTDISLYDGRILAQNGWYVLHSPLPADRTGRVLSWTITPNAIEGWVRQPNIGFSQVGYLPDQPKLAIIELDKNDNVADTASIWRIREDGSKEKAWTGPTKEWGDYFKYKYVHFDFTPLSEPGVYYIEYADQNTGNFIIGDDVYDHITDATTDVWVPIHLNHMTVNEAYRIWHGEPFREGYLQAPENTDHFDLHWQKARDTNYADLELIPGLNVGGFFDAGDFDIETGSNINVVMNLVSAWERFHPQRDATFVSEEQRYVDLHRPDSVPDMLQYIEHGVLQLLAQAEQIGHMAQCLSNSVLDNYHHLGDAASITDGLHYDPSLRPYEVSQDGLSSGTPDDMWAFTTRNPALDMQAATMFAAASRVLSGYNDALAQRCLYQSRRLQHEADSLMRLGYDVPTRGINQELASLSTNIHLYATTGDERYADAFKADIYRALQHMPHTAMYTALDAVPYLDDSYRDSLRPFVEAYKTYLDSLAVDNPYGIPIGLGNWAGGIMVLNHGTTVCTAAQLFPDIIPTDYAYRVANWLFGAHQYHNYSLVAAVGAARPKEVFYGNNRADFSFIPGNVAPGLLFRNPDHFENYDDWPFLWGQNEGTIAGNTAYIIFSLAFRDLVCNKASI